jgi:hypothetical protein
MMVVISPRPSGRWPVTAATVTRPERSRPALVMNALAPSITHSSPSRVALVRSEPASEPPPGSVRPKAASRSPVASGRSQRPCCSPSPKRQIGMAPRLTAASRVIATEESTLASSSTARHSVR